MVLEYLDGRTVQRELEIDGPFALARVAHIARQALHALGAAHGQGLIHRDVKPDNLLLMRVGNDADYTKILDFGVAKLMQGAAADRSQLALTAAGMVFGTPEFMSPEQACGHELDGRSDLYSLAVTMFVMLTGTTLFEGKTAIEWLTHHARTPAPHLAMVRPELGAYPELDDLLQRCLAKPRDERPETAAEMAAQLTALAPTLTHTPAAASRPVAAAVTPASQFHASSYFHALRDADPAGTTAPDPPAGRVVSAPTIGLPAATQRPRRGLYVWLGGVAIASLIGLAVGVAIRTAASRSTASSPEAHAVAGAVVIDAGRADVGPGDAARVASPADAGAVAPPGDAATPAVAPPGDAATPAPVHVSAPVRNTAAEEHLRNAEDAFRGDKPLKQLSEADLALKANPRSVRAKFLLGDALIKSGDLDRGCTYLHALKRNQVAHDRAREAGCPGD